jgi:bla regulator protein blaR1
MDVSPMYMIVEPTVAVSLAIAVVGLARKPLRRIGGARVAYLLWLLVPASALVVSLPAPSRLPEAGSVTIPRLNFDALSHSATIGNYVPVGGDLASLGMSVWAMGCLLMLAFMIFRQRAFMRSLRDVTPAADGTYRSASVIGPVLVGIWRPRVVLPVDFETRYSPEERAFVLAHEEAHKKRFDVLVNAIATVWLCVSWFNPLMYWAVARLRFDQELACDAAVLAESDAGRRRYAEALLKTQLATESAWRMPIGCHWQSGHPLSERVAMLKHPLPGVSRRLTGVLLTAVMITSGSYVAWAAQPAPVDPSYEISADHVSILENGDIDYSGNVIVRLKSMNRAPQVTVTPGNIEMRPDGSSVLEGIVRFLFSGGRLIETRRAILEKDGTIRMDSARASLTSAVMLESPNIN